jgi:PHP family Zn ribbon phosphoesterase
MEITKNTLARLNEIRIANAELKKANKTRSTKRDLLIEEMVKDSLELYVANKEVFPTYNGFIKAYKMELLSHTNENEKSLHNVIEMVAFALKNGLGTVVKYGTIGKIYKYSKTMDFKALKKAGDKKAVNKLINQAKKAYNDALLGAYSALVQTLDNKSIEQIEEIREVLSIVNAQRKAKK